MKKVRRSAWGWGANIMRPYEDRIVICLILNQYMGSTEQHKPGLLASQREPNCRFHVCCLQS